jgi:hypothetical protein
MNPALRAHPKPRRSRVGASGRPPVAHRQEQVKTDPVSAQVRGVPVFCSWSGGKDSALALYEAIAHGAWPRLLISMMTEGGQRSRSHGLSREVLPDPRPSGADR